MDGATSESEEGSSKRNGMGTRARELLGWGDMKAPCSC
jgi:hypothetical protein